MSFLIALLIGPKILRKIIKATKKHNPVSHHQRGISPRHNQFSVTVGSLGSTETQDIWLGLLQHGIKRRSLGISIPRGVSLHILVSKPKRDLEIPLKIEGNMYVLAINVSSVHIPSTTVNKQHLFGFFS